MVGVGGSRRNDLDALIWRKSADIAPLRPAASGPMARDRRYNTTAIKLWSVLTSRSRRRLLITNEVLYRATKAHLQQFEEALANLEAGSCAGKRTKLAQLKFEAVRSQAADLRDELDEYDRLRSGEVSTFEAFSLALADVATLLVKARIARGWTQRRLAETLGFAEQQVQRYESTGYRSASLARICDVAAALGVSVTETAQLVDPDAA